MVNKIDNHNGAAKEASSDESKMKTGNSTFTAAQLSRRVKCRTCEGEIVEVPWHLMMQSKTFRNMWETLGAEEAFDQHGNDEAFIFSLNDITSVCFGKIIEWLEQHNGQPEPVVKEEPITRERVWFTFTEWERKFLEIDFEVLKEFYLAANFLEVKSLFLYCAQECARRIMDKSPEEIRKMLCLPDDLTEQEKDAIRAEFEIADNFGGAGQLAANGNDGGQPPVVNRNADAGQPAVNGNDEKRAINGNDA